MASAEKPTLLLTFDVEDWFQVENFKSYIPYSLWDSFDLRVWKNTLRVLDILDGFAFKPRATFFILGWVAKRLPALVREISNRGHEVASHGYGHTLCHEMDSAAFFEDLISSKAILEDITGQAVIGYRAPSFSINDQALNLVRETGYLYDASFNSFSSNSRYGNLDLSGFSKKSGVYQITNNFLEIPISNLRFNNHILPLGGGGYFRLLPFPFFKQGIHSVLKKEKAFVFYAHPWEFDPNQPRVHQASLGFKFRHYINLGRTQKKLDAMITYFSNYPFKTLSAQTKVVKDESFS
jgi:polysaccharide deacetylase family protein (PEP-CTERM system associated)